jgi:acetoin utilization protein AcuB
MGSLMSNSFKPALISAQNLLYMKLNLPVSTIMTSPVTCVQPEQLLVDLKHIYEQVNFHHHVPVTENDTLIGVVSLIDFMREVHHATLDDNDKVYQTKKVRDIMSLNPYNVPSDTPLIDVVENLSTGQFNSVIITENGKVTGIVTTADLLKLLLKEG